MSIHEAGTAWAAHARRHRTPTAILALTMLGLLLAGLVPRSGAEAAAPGPPAALLPKTGAFLGAWVKPRGGETIRDSIQRVEQQIGRKFAIDHQYYQWNSSIPTAHESWTVSQGRIPFINWKMPSPWRSVASGSQDQWIASRADAFKAFGHPVYLSIHHEPENDGTYGSQADYVAAYRHVIDIFRSRGVSNVAFSWTMMAWSFDVRSGESIQSWYPGDSYVDVIGADGYNWAPGRAGSKWTMAASVFDNVNTFATSRQKPWMAVEYGVQEDPSDPNRKAAWLADLANTAKSWPLLRGLIYFDATKAYPWDTDSSSRSMQGYARMAADPHLSLRLGSTPPPPSPTQTPTPSPTQTPTPSPTQTPTPTTTPTPTPPPVDPTTQLVNSLDAGQTGQTLSVANTSGGGSPFDSITMGSKGPIVFDPRDATGGGGFSALHTSGSGEPSFFGWQDSLAWSSPYWGRVYLRFNEAPADDLRVVRAKDGALTKFAIVVGSNARLKLLDASTRVVGVTDSKIELRGWVRVEWMVDHATGSAELRLFNDRGTSATATLRVSGQNLGDRTDRISIGRVKHEVQATRFWTDVPSLSVLGWLGPDES